MINVKGPILAIALLSIGNFPAISMEDFDESKIKHIRVKNTDKINKYNKKIEVYQSKIKELEELEILFQNLSIGKPHGSNTLPKPDFSFSANQTLLPSFPKELRGSSNKKLEAYDKDEHLSSGEEITAAPIPKTPELIIKDPNPFEYKPFTPPSVKRSEDICVSPHSDVNLSTVNEIMTKKLANYTQEQRINIVSPNVRVGTNSKNIHDSILGGTRRDSPPEKCIKNYLKWKQENKK